MKPEIEQRSEAIQDMIGASTLDPTTKSLLSSNVAKSAEATNGLSADERIHALSLNLYTLTEYIAILSIQLSSLPCHGKADSATPCATTSTTNRGITKTKLIDMIFNARWAIVTLILGVVFLLAISPHLPGAIAELADVANTFKTVK